jgi:hypothetical protein
VLREYFCSALLDLNFAQGRCELRFLRPHQRRTSSLRLMPSFESLSRIIVALASDEFASNFCFGGGWRMMSAVSVPMRKVRSNDPLLRSRPGIQTS